MVIDTPQPQLSQQAVVPSIHLRRFADHDRSTIAYEARGVGEGELRWPEPSGDHRVEEVVGDKPRHVRTRHRDPILPSEPPDQSFQGVSALRSTIEQRQMNGWEIMGDDQSRHTTATPQIENGLHTMVLARLEGTNEPAGVRDHLRDRSGSEKPNALRVQQRVDERLRRLAAHARSGRLDDDAAVGILANRPARHVGFLVEHVVDNLTVR